MLALKVFAARIADQADVRALIRHLGLQSATEIKEMVEQYLPSRLLTAKHRVFSESCLEGEGMPFR